MEPVALLPRTSGDQVDVVARTVSHLVAVRLAVLRDARLTDPITQLAELVPDLLPLPAAIPLEQGDGPDPSPIVPEQQD